MVATALFELTNLIGTFEKPRYIDYDDAIALILGPLLQDVPDVLTIALPQQLNLLEKRSNLILIYALAVEPVPAFAQLAPHTINFTCW